MLGLCLMKRLLALLFISTALPVLAQGVPLTTPAEKAASQAIDANLLRGHVRFLAHDLLEGRGPG
ncbi:MAG: peptidase M28, partial [Hyalangium sp.]